MKAERRGWIEVQDLSETPQSLLMDCMWQVKKGEWRMTELLGMNTQQHGPQPGLGGQVRDSRQQLRLVPSPCCSQAHPCPFSQRAHRTLDVAELGHSDSPQFAGTGSILPSLVLVPSGLTS